MTKVSAIRVLSIKKGGALKITNRQAPRISDKARAKIRKAEDARAEIVQRAATIRMG